LRHSAIIAWRIGKAWTRSKAIRRLTCNYPGGSKCRTAGFARAIVHSALRDHDLAEMAAALEMPVGVLCLGERECLVDHRTQAMHS
jgi:hypothetical protein